MTHELESDQVKTILICTVGGSHEPIIKAIESSRPHHVCFFCTDRDPVSGRKGSREQIEGERNVIKAKPSDEKPTLPNIPTQLQLEPSQFSIYIVPADDLDAAVVRMRQTASDLGGRFPEAKFIADYTGGTKTMSAALVCLALEWEELNLKLVRGTRANLEKVRQGTERPVFASITRLRQRRQMIASLKAWQRYAYQEAEEDLKAIQVSTDSPEGNQITSVRLTY